MSGDLLVADWDDLEKNIVSEVHVKRFKSPEVRAIKVQGQVCSHLLSSQ